MRDGLLRERLVEGVLGDLLGPGGGAEEEVADRRVTMRYLLGMLAPQRDPNADAAEGALAAGRSESAKGVDAAARNDAATDDDEEDNAQLELTLEGRDDDLATVDGDAPDDGTDDAGNPVRDTLVPSSFGMSVSVDGAVAALHITARWGSYERRHSETLVDPKTERPRMVWKRTSRGGAPQLLALREGPIDPPLTVDPSVPAVQVQGNVQLYQGDWLVTLFLVNTQQSLRPMTDDARWLFQAELEVAGAHDEAPFVRRPVRSSAHAAADDEDASERAALDMLYRDRAEFAVGHGTGVHAEVDATTPLRALRITTRAVPAFEVPSTQFPGPADTPGMSALELDMAVLAGLADDRYGEVLLPLVDAYARWIGVQRTRIGDAASLLPLHEDAAREALMRCDEAAARIRAGIEVLGRDATAREAFRFANRVMHAQRVRGVYTREVRAGRSVALEAVDVPANRSWRPFQLAFVLMNLPALADVLHEDRRGDEAATADLLWFPTGGGKTEAYLGLAALAMALRRLQGEVDGHDGRHGVAVLMRYTLRLLTLQQFQRASALLCACEVERRRDSARWGDEPFRIGLWVGRKATPNTTAESASMVAQLRDAAQGFDARLASLGSPHQLSHCPWCGAPIRPGADLHVEQAPKGRGRTFTYCSDATGACAFSRRGSANEGLPVVVVDEEVYRLLPDLVIATVDKFAQMPWNGRTQMLFGRVTGRCERHGFRSPELDDADSHPAAGALPAARSHPHIPLRPPDLIIQDELHLISGPLGSMVGLYETAVDALASWTCKGVRVHPKIIASTATVRRAPAQVRHVFARRLAVFPPHGLDARDSFFAVERPTDLAPGRLYLGVCARGFRLKSVLIRVYTALLASAQRLADEQGAAADPWMTLVGYFNALRELGGMRRLVDDDVRSRLWSMAERGLGRRPTPVVEELTSRMDAVRIPRILARLELPVEPRPAALVAPRRRKATDERPVDVLLATNMLAVGVDISRLGLMVVAGQPKSTAEYIQATSRVGRAAPGLVVTVFNWARPRDLSHYESFEQYHAGFYRHVEALSVTPFAEGALARGLSGVLAAMIRLDGEAYVANARAGMVQMEDAAVQHVLAVLRARAARVAGEASRLRVHHMLDRRMRHWLSEATSRSAAGAQLGYVDAKERVSGLLASPGDGRWQLFTCLQSLRDVEEEANLVLHVADGREVELVDAETDADMEVPS
jgi:hypothetical protein